MPTRTTFDPTRAAERRRETFKGIALVVSVVVFVIFCIALGNKLDGAARAKVEKDCANMFGHFVRTNSFGYHPELAGRFGVNMEVCVTPFGAFVR